MPDAPRSTIFISYASENRSAARLLKDSLTSSGLDVWYDESELGGGDAWDQKIRRQIRECTYFMPVVSAQTEARREGYFRREWRLAVERSHDMADDAMFLVPVVIDDTSQASARVPEKFLAVQWLRVPGGTETQGLRDLGHRLATGEHLSAPPAAPPPLAHGTRSPAAQTAAPTGHEALPMPPFPIKPADRHERLKYLAEVVWWVLNTARMLFKRMPGWARTLVILWLVFGVVLKSCRTGSDSEKNPVHVVTKTPNSLSTDKSGDGESLKEAASRLEKLANDPNAGNLKSGLARAGMEIAKAVSGEVDDTDGWTGRVELIPFAAETPDAKEGKLADEVFSRVFSQLSQARPSQVKVQPAQNTDDLAFLSRAADKAGDDFVAVGKEKDSEIVVRLLGTQGPEPVWTGHFPLGSGDASEIADRVSQGLVAALRANPRTPAPKN
jgi:hypothetical protein